MKIIIDIPEDTYQYYVKLANKGEQLNNLESIILDGTPPQSAHWTLYRDHKNMIDYPQCDNCNAVIKLPLPIDNLNFCPNCGRKIEDVESNP